MQQLCCRTPRGLPIRNQVHSAGHNECEPADRMSTLSSQRVSILPAEALREMALGRCTGSGEVFFRPDWFDLLARTTLQAEERERVRLYCVGYLEDGNCFCLPTIQHNTADGSVKLEGLANYYSSLYGPIFLGSEFPVEEMEAAVRAIRDGNPRVDMVQFSPLDPDSVFFRNLISHLRRCGYWADSYFCFGNWYLSVVGNFEQYFASRSSQLRNTVTRAQRKLERDPSYCLTIHTEDSDSLLRAIAQYETVYSKSWKQPEPHPGFIPELCRLAARNGWLRLGVVELDNIPVAAQIWLVTDRRASIFKLAYDERFAKRSVGSVLTTALMAHVIDRDRVIEVDYLTGDDEYKKAWMSNRRERQGIIAFSPRTIRGILGAVRHFGRRHAKALYRLLRPA